MASHLIDIGPIFAKAEAYVDAIVDTAGTTVAIIPDPGEDLSGPVDWDTLEIDTDSTEPSYDGIPALVVLAEAGRQDDIPEGLEVRPGDARIILKARVTDVQEGNVVIVQSSGDPRLLDTRWVVFAVLGSSANAARVLWGHPLRRGVGTRA